MFWEQPVQFASQSDIGLRRGNNEDSTVVRLSQDAESFAEHGHLFVVADGMGGHAVGELASKLAVETVPLVFFKSHGTERVEALRASVVEANRVINERGMANLDFRRMGTTCTTLLLSPDGVTVAHVGDSRAYRVRDHRIDQLTFDHSLQWEMQRQGRVPPDEDLLEARNVITRSLGPESAVDVDVEGPFPVVDRDSFVLCSDGLTAHVQDGEIGAAVRYLPPEEACRFLVNLALVRGGSDNVTVVVIGVGASPTNSISETSTRLHVAVERSRPRLGWVVATCLVLAGTLVAGLAGEWTVMSVLLAIAVASAFSALVLGGRRREIVRNESTAEGEGDTEAWRPHASASAQLTKRFLGELQSLERELERAAREEEWRVDWEKRDRASEDARESIEANRHSRAFASLAKAIDALVSGIVAQRKEVKRQARWGRAASD